MQKVPVVGFENLYEVDEQGIVYRNTIKRSGSGYIVSQWKQQNEYRMVTLRDGKRVKHYSVHFCVLASFTNDRRKEGLVCRHKDGVKTNNSISNLEWGTPRQNHFDKKKHGTFQEGEKHGNHKLTSEQVIFARSSKLNHTEIGKMFNVTPECIAYARNIGWRSLGANQRAQDKVL